MAQKSFEPAETFPELRARLKSYDDSSETQCGERSGDGHRTMQAARKKKGVSSSGCYICGRRGHMARNCRSRNSGQCGTRGSGSNEAIEQRCKDASGVGKLDTLQDSASTGGQDSSAAVLHLERRDMGYGVH